MNTNLLLVFAAAISAVCADSPNVVRLEPKILEAYTGQYQASPDTIVTIRRGDNRLTFQVNQGSPIELFPESEERFFHKDSPTKVSFVRDEQGQVTQMILHRGGDHAAKRIVASLPPDKTQAVAIGEDRFRVLATGTGDVTVVLVSGIEYWSKVRPELEGLARVISYEFPEKGTLGGESARKTARETVLALHAMLKKVQAPPPYLMVGQSFGGALVRIFADSFPDEVVGLVLVDPFHEAFIDWLKIHQPEHYESFRRNCARYASNWDELLEDLRRAQPPSKIPMTLLTAGQRQIREDSPLEQSIKADDFVKGGQAILKAHREWVARASKGKHIVVPASGHEIPIDQPDFVAQAIREMLKQIGKR